MATLDPNLPLTSTQPPVQTPVRDLQTLSSDPATLLQNGQTQSQAVGTNSSPETLFGQKLTQMLQTYQGLGTKPFVTQGLNAQDAQLQASNQALTNPALQGYSPGTIQNAGQAATAPFNPLIQGANNARQTYSEQLNAFGNIINNAKSFLAENQAQQQQAKANAQDLIHTAVGAGSDALNALIQSQPDIVKIAGYSSDTLNGISAALKKQETLAAQQQATQQALQQFQLQNDQTQASQNAQLFPLQLQQQQQALQQSQQSLQQNQQLAPLQLQQQQIANQTAQQQVQQNQNTLTQQQQAPQQTAQAFALQYGINKPFYIVAGTVYRTSDGHAFTSQQDFQTQTGMDTGTAGAQGLIQDISGQLPLVNKSQTVQKLTLQQQGSIPATGTAKAPTSQGQTTVDAMANALINGDLAPSQLPGFGQNSLKAQVLARAYQLNPNFDAATAEQQYQFGKSTKTQTVQVMASTALQTIDRAIANSNNVDRSNLTFVNGVLNAAKNVTSDPTYAQWVTDINALGDEIGTVLGQGSATDFKTRLGLIIANPNLSQKAFAAALNELGTLFKNRLAGIQTQTGNSPQGTSGVTSGGNSYTITP